MPKDAEVSPRINEKIKIFLINRAVAEVQNSSSLTSNKKAGALEGLELCRGLVDFDQFDALIFDRLTKEREIKNSDDYWRSRCGTIQIEKILEKMMVIWGLKPSLE